MRIKSALHPFVFVISLYFSSAVLGDENWGRFNGTIQVKFLPDGRSVQLTAPFFYTDPTGIIWDAPAGSIVDGASIPGWAWSFVGGPFEDKYRDASVIHDVACIRKNKPWEYTHLAFYYAMRAAGVSELQADIMYAAVYHFGPRWPFEEQVTADEENDAKRKILVDRYPGTKVKMVGAKKRIPDLANPKHKQWQYRLELEPPEPLSDPKDFEKLKKTIEDRQGKVSLGEIRAWKPTP
jgi:Protein of unknown function (DUF1353)